MTPRPLFACLLAAALLSAALPVSAADDVKLGESTGYVAPGGALTSLKGLHAFVDKAFDTRFEIDKAAKVENLVIEKDAGKLTLTGWIFLRGGVDGVRYRAMFFGDGRFELAAPIKMEREQIKRFLQTEAIDKQFKQCRFTFTGAADQQIFESLAFTAEAAKEAEEKNEDCKGWLAGVRDFLAKGEQPDAAARRRFEEFALSATAYERFLDPKREGTFNVEMTLKPAEGIPAGASRLTRLEFDYDPYQLEEVTVAGTWDHGKGSPQSLITQFHAKGQYDSTSDRNATSAFIEAENKTDLGLKRNKLKMEFDPGGKHDIKMRSEMELVVLGDELRYLAFYIVPYMGTTKCWFEGKEAEFYHPSIPGQEWFHSRFIIVAIPRVLKKGETVNVTMELEGKILENVNGATWMVKEEDNWFPNPSLSLGGVATWFDTTIVTPKGFTAIANGREQPCDPADVRPDAECYHYVTNTGIDFATFNIGRDFRIDKGESLDAEDITGDGKPDGKIPIRVYTNATAKNEFSWRDPDNPALVQRRSYSLSENGPDAVGRAQIARKVYTKWFGPCPYDTLMITPHPKGHGRGSASLLLVWQDAFLSSTAQAEWASLTGRPYNPFDMPAFLVHEIAHQWWGGAVRIRGGRDQWFSEGFADYGAALVLEELDKVNGSKWFDGKMSEFRHLLLSDDGYSQWVTPLCLGNRFVSAENRPPYDRGIARQNFMYSKGSYVMHMLRILARSRMGGDPIKGDELFRQAMHDFVSSCVRSGKAPSNLDMEKSFTKSMGMPLDWFFDQWIYGMGVPRVEWSYKVEPAADGTWVVKGKLRQKDTSFQFPLAVSFFFGKEENFGYVWIGKQESEFTIPLPKKPDKVAVNGDYGVLGIFKEASGSAAGQ